MPTETKKIELLSENLKRIGVQGLANRPNASGNQYGESGLSADKLKERFDVFPEKIRQKVNDIIAMLSGGEAAKYIAINYNDLEIETIPDVPAPNNLYDLLVMISDGSLANALKVNKSTPDDEPWVLSGIINELYEYVSSHQEEINNIKTNLENKIESDLESAKTELEDKIEGATNLAAKYLDDIQHRALPPMLYIAHRGGALWNVTSADGSTRYFPANTLVGLSTAIRHGFTTLEVDVGRTKDGVFVVYEHDTVDGTAVGNLTLSSIRSKVKITSVVDKDGTTIKATEQVPTLDQVLALCSGLDVDIVLNVKSSTHGKASEIVRLLEDYGLKNHAYISSHDLEELEAYKNIDNSMPLVMLYHDGYTPSKSELDDVYKHLKTPINIVFVGMSDDSDIQTACEYVKESNLDGIIAYTIDTQSKLDELSPYIIGCLTNTSFAQEPSHIGNGSRGCYARPSNSTARGIECYANSGQGSMASGSYSETGCTASHALGYGTLTKTRNGQLACGFWNQADANALFVVGCGTGANGRKNAFVVYDDAIKVGSTKATENQVAGLLAHLDEVNAEKDFATPEMYADLSIATTDATEAIQAAINSGKPVYLESRIYRTSAPITIPSNAYVIGKKTKISYSGTDAAIIIEADKATLDLYWVEAGNGTGVRVDTTTAGTYNCRIKIHTIVAKKYGLHLYGNGKNACYNEFQINIINAQDIGILSEVHSGFINENKYLLNNIRNCNVGIMLYGDTVDNSTGANKVYNAVFEGIKSSISNAGDFTQNLSNTCAVYLHNSSGNLFEDCRTEELFGNKYIVFSGKCNYNDIEFSDFSVGKIDISNLDKESMINNLKGARLVSVDGYGWAANKAVVSGAFGISYNLNGLNRQTQVNSSNFPNNIISPINNVIFNRLTVPADESLNGKTFWLHPVYSEMGSETLGCPIVFYFQSSTKGFIKIVDNLGQVILDNSTGQYQYKTVSVKWIGYDPMSSETVKRNLWDVQVFSQLKSDNLIPLVQ